MMEGAMAGVGLGGAATVVAVQYLLLLLLGFTAGNYTEVQLLDISVVKLGATFDTASQSTENCMSALVSDFKCLVDSVESQVSTVQWCYTKKTLNNICSVLNELSTKCETIYCHTQSVTRQIGNDSAKAVRYKSYISIVHSPIQAYTCNNNKKRLRFKFQL